MDVIVPNDTKIVHCDNSPLPAIIMGIAGAITVMSIAIIPGIDRERRIFGIILIILWTAIWAVVLIMITNECQPEICWWLLLISIIIMLIFFIPLIVFE